MTFLMNMPSVLRRPVFGSVLCALSALTWPWGVHAATAAAAVEPVSPCFVTPPEDLAAAFDYDCGYVVAPEDASAPDGRKVKLSFLRLQARTRKTASPLFMLAGGPGLAITHISADRLRRPGLDTARRSW